MVEVMSLSEGYYAGLIPPAIQLATFRVELEQRRWEINRQDAVSTKRCCNCLRIPSIWCTVPLRSTLVEQIGCCEFFGQKHTGTKPLRDLSLLSLEEGFLLDGFYAMEELTQTQLMLLCTYRTSLSHSCQVCCYWHYLWKHKCQ